MIKVVPKIIEGRMSVLMIDDDPFNHVMTEGICESFNWNCTPAHTAEEGMRKALAADYDIILLDFHLDGKNKGNEVAKVIRDSKLQQRIYSYSTEEVADEEYGGRPLWNGHLDKNNMLTALNTFREDLLRNGFKSPNVEEEEVEIRRLAPILKKVCYQLCCWNKA